MFGAAQLPWEGGSRLWGIGLGFASVPASYPGMIAVTLPATVVAVRALRVAVAGWPTLIFTAFASGNPATTCRFPRVAMVMKALDDPEDDEELDDADEDPVPELEPEDADEPLPLTVWPTDPLTAVMVPAKGAVRVVSDRVLVSWVTVDWAWVTWA